MQTQRKSLWKKARRGEPRLVGVSRTVGFRRVAYLGSGALNGGNFLKLNIGSRPIAKKYREGKVKRTLKRELSA